MISIESLEGEEEDGDFHYEVGASLVRDWDEESKRKKNNEEEETLDKKVAGKEKGAKLGSIYSICKWAPPLWNFEMLK